MEEKEQAEISYISMMEDIAADEGEDDKKEFEKIKNDNVERIEQLKCKSFIRDEDGYIFINF